MQTDKAVAHLALDLRARHERRDGVDHDDVDRAGAHERLGDLKRLLAGVRLGDEHILDLDAKRAGVGDVERMLGVDERDLAARLLRLGEHMQRQRRLTGGFRPVNFDDTALGQAPDTERQVERQRARGDGLHIAHGVVAKAHDRALAVGALDLLHRGLDRPLLVVGHRRSCLRLRLFCHVRVPPDSLYKLNSLQMVSTRVPYTTRGMLLRSLTI